MKPKLLVLILFLTSNLVAFGQYRVHGRITNTKLEPLAFVSIQVKDFRLGTTSKEDGSYELFLDEGRQDLVISMIGYKSQLLTIIVRKTAYEQNVLMEEEGKDMTEIVVKGKAKDRSEEIIRNVIRNKDNILSAAGAWSAEVYIKATQEDSLVRKKKKKKVDSAVIKNPEAAVFNQMAMAEVVLRLDHKFSNQVKEERTGIKKRGNAESLFYLSTTDGDFNFYNNLLKTPVLSETPFLSPVSYSGLIAYKYKLVKTELQGTRKIYTISVKPGKLSNATVEGEITIADSLWIILHTRFRFPSYHLPEYDFFEVEQHYEYVDQKAWMITRQEFNYSSKNNKGKKSGQTVVAFRNFELNKDFPKNHFGTEISSTTQEAYEKDSNFWKTNRTEPLTLKETRFILYKDSMFRATHTKSYLDSMDRVINKITWKKALLTGQTFNDHVKERRWYIPPLPNMIQLIQFGGTRIQASVNYFKTFKSKKNLMVFTDLSYGLRNHDINGGIRVHRMYNPFNRGFFNVYVRRNFEYIFSGDAWINMLKRNNFYLNSAISFEHGLELMNGLNLFTGIEFAHRQSLSEYKTNSNVDSLFGDYLENNQAVEFESYKALYGVVRLQFTPKQRYIREPKEKIILGSSWPTFYTYLRKGLPGIMQSVVDFDYLEFGMQQEIKAGLLGISSYTVRTGRFINQNNLQQVDYKWQRRGDPILFMNPNEAFQSLDSTFAVFKRFYEGHYVHEFNGALLNKIPLLKKLGLREMGGAGFLFAPERNLRYFEAYAGIERIFKWPFDTDSKFKFGVYVVGSAANQFHNPVRFKIGITSWDKRRNKWY
ncbi:MAG: DUF5686 and carboxypeptidase regulatory-like domain-containing protein [Flavisolibacter sp.]